MPHSDPHLPDSTPHMPDSTPRVPDSWHTRVPLLSAASGLKWVMATSHVVCLCVCLFVCLSVCLLACLCVCLLACFLAWRSRCSQQQREADVSNTGTGVTLSHSGNNDSLHKRADFQPSFLVKLGTARKPGTSGPWSSVSAEVQHRNDQLRRVCCFPKATRISSQLQAGTVVPVHVPLSSINMYSTVT